jgi:hypothetical protein
MNPSVLVHNIFFSICQAIKYLSQLVQNRVEQIPPAKARSHAKQVDIGLAELSAQQIFVQPAAYFDAR